MKRKLKKITNTLEPKKNLTADGSDLITVRLPKELTNKLKKTAKANDVSTSKLIREILIDYLK